MAPGNQKTIILKKARLWEINFIIKDFKGLRNDRDCKEVYNGIAVLKERKVQTAHNFSVQIATLGAKDEALVLLRWSLSTTKTVNLENFQVWVKNRIATLIQENLHTI